MKKAIRWIILPIFILTTLNIRAEIKLPKILGSNMVLQRDVEFKIWGWADKNEKITIRFNGIVETTEADKAGNWLVTFPPMKAGGPYVMIIEGKNIIELKNILVGDVWICSGQSNMEWPLSSAKDAEYEMAGASYPHIRLFRAPHNIQYKPVKDVPEGEWKECVPDNVGDFSAVGYFFGRHIHKEINVPIGLLFTSWGGTNVETWTSTESISQVEGFKDRIADLERFNPDEIIAERKVKIEKILADFGADGKGIVDGKPIWADPDLDISKWKDMELPQLWENAGLDGLDGLVWFRKEFELPVDVAAKGIILELGPIDDSDITWVNGKKVGEMKEKYRDNRIYTVAPEILNEGRNVVAVRVEDYRGGGGLWGKPEQLKVRSENFEQSLAGTWKYRISSLDLKINISDFIGPNSYPTLLFNGMIHPFLNFTVKGVIWYQGESNASRAYQYRTLFPLMIKDWREKWNHPDMPFLFVQLANYQKPPVNPGESEWAELREAQLMALSLSNTGMAITIDVGEADDIHPRNKQDVGKRLALAAMKIVYGKDIVYSGPIYKSMQVEDKKVIIEFDHIGSGLKICDRYGYLKGFAVAGENQKFYWAKAYIMDNRVIVYSDEVEKPVAVRYGWADNPDDVNLYNQEGLPASPFRTDDWKGITYGNK